MPSRPRREGLCHRPYLGSLGGGGRWGRGARLEVALRKERVALMRGLPLCKLVPVARFGAGGPLHAVGVGACWEAAHTKVLCDDGNTERALIKRQVLNEGNLALLWYILWGKVGAAKATSAHPLAQELNLGMEECWVGVVGVDGGGKGVVRQEDVHIGPNNFHNAMLLS